MFLCSPHGGRSKRKGKGIWARDHARGRRGRELRHETTREGRGVGGLGNLGAREKLLARPKSPFPLSGVKFQIFVRPLDDQSPQLGS